VTLLEAIGEARALVGEVYDGSLAGLAHETLDLVEAHADELGAEGKDRAQAILARYSLGDLDGARLLYLGHVASYAERRRASAEMTLAVSEDTAARVARWESFERGLKTLGVLGVRYGFLALTAVL